MPSVGRQYSRPHDGCKELRSIDVLRPPVTVTPLAALGAVIPVADPLP
jgi:hypothetical protein